MKKDEIIGEIVSLLTIALVLVLVAAGAAKR